jgi:uncharacterized membrane protein
MNSVFGKMNFEDISQIVIGAAVMAIPIAFSEELWNFGETLPLPNILMLAILSVSIQFFYTNFSLFQGNEERYSRIFFRVLLNYVITFLTVGIILFALNRPSLSSDLLVGFKRMVILRFPASLGAVIVDGFDKE